MLPNIDDLCRLQDILLLQLKKGFEEKSFLSQRQKDGRWQTWTYKDIVQCALQLAKKMRAMDIQPQDKVVLRVKNGPYWLICELAILFNQQIVVPVYTTANRSSLIHIQTVTDAKYILADEDLSEKEISDIPWKIINIRQEIALFRQNVKGTKNTDIEVPEISTNQKDALITACIIFSSGTSGNPRGVVLSHNALIKCVIAILKRISESSLMNVERHRFYSFLPLSHAYEHIAGLWLPIIAGAEIYYPYNAETVISDMSSASPTLVTTVPRLFETMRLVMLKKLAVTSKLKLAILKRGMSLAKHDYENWSNCFILFRWFNKIEFKLIQRILHKIALKRFGDKIIAFISGGAALHPQIEQLMMALGVSVLNGYGLTEYSPTVSVNLPEKNRKKSVGCPLPGVEIVIADDGEILLKGEQMMDGYYNAPNATKASIINGYLHTGDIGYIDKDGYVFITDRKKDIIITSGGENVSPTNLELNLELESEISQAYVEGNSRPYLVAVLVADESIPDNNKQTALQQAVSRVNQRISKHENIRFFIMAKEAFAIENELLTPTLKIKRKSIQKRYQQELDAQYKSIK